MLTGKNVLVRTFRDADVLRVLDFRNAAATEMPHNGQPFGTPPKFMSMYRESGLWSRDGGTMLICPAVDSEVLLGEVDFCQVAPHTIDVAYMLYRTSDWGKGYSSEALKLFIDNLFSTRSTLNRAQLRVHTDNVGSLRVAEKCGFVREGVARESIFLGGRYCDQHTFALLRKEWRKA